MGTAISLCVLTLTGFGLYGWWAADLVRHGSSLGKVMVIGLLVYLGLVALVTALWFAIAWIYRATRPPECRIRVARTIKLVVQEYVTLLGSPWRMGVAWWFMREPLTAPASSPVVLVHGVLCNSGVWLGMREMLRA